MHIHGPSKGCFDTMATSHTTHTRARASIATDLNSASSTSL